MIIGNNFKQPSFKNVGTAKVLRQGLSLPLKAADLFLKSQESLAYTRFLQDSATNWLPKAIFSRSVADFGEMSFLELLESGLFYFAAPLLGEHLLRKKVFSNFIPKASRAQVDKLIPKKIGELSGSNGKRAIAIKAAIVLGCAAIPAAEYALSFAKNLFTLKVFKKCNFENIANLDKNHHENKEHQKNVEKSAKAHIAKATIFSVAALGAATAIAAFGHKSNALQKISKGILEPGAAVSKALNKIGVKSKKTDSVLSKISLDFDGSMDGKLKLGQGMLGLTAIAGLFGYSAAAKDRGKLDHKEVWTRVPLVVLYTLFGTSAFNSIFKHFAVQKGAFKGLIKEQVGNTIKTFSREELPARAQELAQQSGKTIQQEFNKLTKDKALMSGIPYAFGLLFMGFSLAAISRAWTQYRYNKTKKDYVNNAVLAANTWVYPKNLTSFLAIMKDKKVDTNNDPYFKGEKRK